MIDPVSSTTFFKAWVESCQARKENLLHTWQRASDYSTSVLGGPESSVISDVANRLNLLVYREYYALDAVFYQECDLVGDRPTGSTWVQNVRIAFEHENFFTSGLYQETSHLLITRAELRVLVTYPERYPVQPELDRLKPILSKSGLTDPAFLLITGIRNDDKTDICWCGYTWRNGAILPLE